MEYFESNPSSLRPSHVYISFRGDESNRKFIHSLSTALKAEGFRIFGDDKKHEKSDSNLPPHLRQAIGESWIWIVVFSKNYASSSWCFKELARFAQLTLVKYRYVDPLIVEREQRFEAEIDQVNGRRRDLKKGFGPRNVLHRIIAVFYDVDPKSFAHHIQQACAQFEAHYLMEAIEKVVATPSAWDLRNDYVILLFIFVFFPRHMGLKKLWVLVNYSGSRVIQKIVKQVKSEIDKLFYGIFRFVGIQSQVEEVEKLLDLSSDDVVGVVGICGMGGLGKFSIAMVLYLKIFHHFDAFCFLPSVSRRLKQGDITLQELLQRHLGTENSEVRDCLDKEFLACKRLRNHKFLIVLDGIELVQDLQELNLVEKSNCFGGGSRIIITTRDKQVLQNYDV
ncbi:TMV resistance protein N-like [Neltuma alba]|uniref:TMV resistance protein N-like n=1 Tax=Neltuma alba TaxID=207710 RepID=UPI0010A3C60A|nr:TMV resistance protein N-like [Prosopis alba]